jgi:hypothetical protein
MPPSGCPPTGRLQSPLSLSLVDSSVDGARIRRRTLATSGSTEQGPQQEAGCRRGAVPARLAVVVVLGREGPVLGGRRERSLKERAGRRYRFVAAIY